jgi:hypothetical protein
MQNWNFIKMNLMRYMPNFVLSNFYRGEIYEDYLFG